MGIGKKVILVLVTMVMGVSLISCNEDNDSGKVSTQETNYYSTSIEGKKMYYSEDDENVINTKKLTEEFLNYAVKTDYRNKEYLKEYDYYTKEQQEIDELYNTRADVEEMVESWQLILELNSKDIKSVEFYKNKGQENATVTVEYTSTVLNATDEYFEGGDKKLNEKYTRIMNLYVVKEDNQWRVSDYEVTKSGKDE